MNKNGREKLSVFFRIGALVVAIIIIVGYVLQSFMIF